MEKLIGREYEKSLLTSYLQSGQSEFVAVYGRRRVGKTFLIKSFFKNKFDFYATGIVEGSREDELMAFNTALQEYGYEGTFRTTWTDCFQALNELLASKKKKSQPLLVFIDELPCFDTQHSHFIQALDFFWNYYAANFPNLKFIVCGSATSWMIRNIVNSHGGLHNRLTHSIHLHPFDLRQTELYAKHHQTCWSQFDIVQMYMAIGGVPYYWSKLDFQDSVPNNIDRLFFAADAELADEYSRLFASLFKNPNAYIEVIKLLCNKKSGLSRNEISDALGIPSSGTLTKILEDLEYCDFIVGRTNGKKQSNKIFQLSDFYTLFYNTFCGRKISDKHFWAHKIGTPKINTFQGLAYERICMQHTDQILAALHLDHIHTEIFSWRSKESEPASQIDMIIDRADNLVTICEIKFSKAEYTLSKAEYQKIITRAENYRVESKTRKGWQISMITTFGLNNNTYSDISRFNVTLADLFKQTL